MRRTKIINIEGRNEPIEVREICLKDVRELFEELSAPGLSLEAQNESLNKWLPKLTSLPLSALEDYYPNELMMVMDAVKEVNRDFFGPARIVMPPEIVSLLQSRISAIWISKFAGSFGEAIQASSNTDGATS